MDRPRRPPARAKLRLLPKPLWRLRRTAPRLGFAGQRPLALALVIGAHLTLAALLLSPLAASWTLAVQHRGDGSRGASQGALMLLPHSAVPTPRPVPESPVRLHLPLPDPVRPPPLTQMRWRVAAQAPPERAAPPSALASAAADAGNQGDAGSSLDRAHTDTGRSGNQGGGVVQPVSYEAEILAWINRHKRYPRDAVRDRIEGVVGIALELDPWGRLLRVELLASSGSDSLDRAALQQVRDAAPFPRPDAPDWQRKRIALNIAFTLRELERTP